MSTNSDQHLIEGCTWYANNLALYSGIGGSVGNKITYTSNLIFKDNVIIDNCCRWFFLWCTCSIVSNHPMMLVGDEFQPSNWVNAYRSPHKFALSLLDFSGLANENFPNATCTRTKSGTPTESVYGYKDHMQLPLIVNEGFLYNYQFESLPSTKSINVIMDDAEAGDTYLIRFQDFGKLGGLNLISPNGNLPEYTSMNDLTNSNQTAFLRETNGDLYLKYVATQHLQGINISWSTDFSVPILDTDGDGISDREEIENGTDPFPTITSSPDLFIDNSCITLFPNPTNGHFNIQGDFQNYTIQILNSDGNLFIDLSNESVPLDIDISSLPQGLYFVLIKNQINNNLCIQHIIKM